MSPVPRGTVVLASRSSRLARRQTEAVASEMRRAWPDLKTEIRLITTQGDQAHDRPLPEIGGKGLFTQELEQALRAGRADLAVHSLKDLPIEDAEGLILGAIPRRADAREVLVAVGPHRLMDLAAGAVVGTSSLRRQAQVLAIRPDLVVRPIRGSVETRIRKVKQGLFDAVLLAAAGILRLGLADQITEWFDFEVMLPAPGQGALAIQCRQGDSAILGILRRLDDATTRTAVLAERAFLDALGGGCSAPVAAYARVEGRDLHLAGMAASLDGREVIRVQGKGRDPLQLGEVVARDALARGAHRVVQHA